ncbi:MAG TPA: aminotransferase class IV [Vicinamibacterales bacterium]|nr:aminotransferase class IV [Vicinamibacterales bacterium]
MSAIVNVNGQITDDRHAVVSVFDHGFLYGEGVYETLRTYRQRPFLLERHLRRLRNSAEMMALDVPLTDAELGDRIVHTVQHATPLSPMGAEWYIRVLLTRGVGELSYDPAVTPTPTVVIIVKPHADPPQELYTNGVRAIISSIVRNHPGTVSPMIKSNNLMNNALAMQEGIKRGAFEVIMRNYRGELTECSMSNLFLVNGGTVLTPPLSAGLLPGITREVVFEIGSDLGVSVRESTLRDEDLFGAEEVFLTGTTREILPIVEVDDRAIGSGIPGPMTKKLHAEFRRRV